MLLRRAHDAIWGSPFDVSPSTGSEQNSRWEMVLVKKRKARRILYTFQYPPAPLTEIDQAYDGEDPTECEEDCVVEYRSAIRATRIK